jgi:hypothetical protein
MYKILFVTGVFVFMTGFCFPRSESVIVNSVAAGAVPAGLALVIASRAKSCDLALLAAFAWLLSVLVVGILGLRGLASGICCGVLLVSYGAVRSRISRDVPFPNDDKVEPHGT